MRREHIMHALGALLSVAAMYAINSYQRPVFDPQYGEQEYTTATGSLSLRQGADSRELPLMTSHVIAHDLDQGARSYKIRELALRAAGPSTSPASFELYIDLSRIPADLVTAPHDFQVLVQSELPVLTTGRLGSHHSAVLLTGTKPRQVITGGLLLTEIRLVDVGDRQLYRASGRLELQVEGDHGVEMMTGRIEGPITWD